jgi:hypothetical protein
MIYVTIEPDALKVKYSDMKLGDIGKYRRDVFIKMDGNECFTLSGHSVYPKAVTDDLEITPVAEIKITPEEPNGICYVNGFDINN